MVRFVTDMSAWLRQAGAPRPPRSGDPVCFDYKLVWVQTRDVVRELSFCILAVAVGCAAAPATAPTAHPSTPALQQAADRSAVTTSPASDPVAELPNCPGGGASTRVGMEDTHAGAALVFSAREGTTELRRRVSQLSLSSTLEAAKPYEDKIQNGVRLVFHAATPSDAPELRRQVAAFAREVAERCQLVVADPYERTPPAAASKTKASPTPKASSAPASAASSSPAPAKAPAAMPKKPALKPVVPPPAPPLPRPPTQPPSSTHPSRRPAAPGSPLPPRR